MLFQFLIYCCSRFVSCPRTIDKETAKGKTFRLTAMLIFLYRHEKNKKEKKHKKHKKHRSDSHGHGNSHGSSHGGSHGQHSSSRRDHHKHHSRGISGSSSSDSD